MEKNLQTTKAIDILFVCLNQNYYSLPTESTGTETKRKLNKSSVSVKIKAAK